MKFEVDYSERAEQLDNIAQELEDNGYETKVLAEQSEDVELTGRSSYETAEEAYDEFFNDVTILDSVVASPEDSEGHPTVHVYVDESGDLDYSQPEGPDMIEEVKDVLE